MQVHAIGACVNGVDRVDALTLIIRGDETCDVEVPAGVTVWISWPDGHQSQAGRPLVKATRLTVVVRAGLVRLYDGRFLRVELFGPHTGAGA